MLSFPYPRIPHNWLIYKDNFMVYWAGLLIPDSRLLISVSGDWIPDFFLPAGHIYSGTKICVSFLRRFFESPYYISIPIGRKSGIQSPDTGIRNQDVLDSGDWIPDFFPPYNKIGSQKTVSQMRR